MEDRPCQLETGATGSAIEIIVKVSSIQDTQMIDYCLLCAVQKTSHLVSTAKAAEESTHILWVLEQTKKGRVGVNTKSEATHALAIMLSHGTSFIYAAETSANASCVKGIVDMAIIRSVKLKGKEGGTGMEIGELMIKVLAGPISQQDGVSRNLTLM